MNLENIKVLNSNKVKFTDKKIMLELILTSEPLFKSSEIIAIFTKNKDKRSYSDLTIYLEPTANELTNFESLTNGIFKALDNGDFRDLGENKSLFYATLEPVASILKKNSKRANNGLK